MESVLLRELSKMELRGHWESVNVHISTGWCLSFFFFFNQQLILQITYLIEKKNRASGQVVWKITRCRLVLVALLTPGAGPPWRPAQQQCLPAAPCQPRPGRRRQGRPIGSSPCSCRRLSAGLTAAGALEETWGWGPKPESRLACLVGGLLEPRNPGAQVSGIWPLGHIISSLATRTSTQCSIDSRYASDLDSKIAHDSQFTASLPWNNSWQPSLKDKYFLPCVRVQSHGFWLCKPLTLSLPQSAFIFP